VSERAPHNPESGRSFSGGERSRAQKTRVLFLCTRNSCRSQMAEGWARHLHGDVTEPYSAGTDPGTVDPLAVRVMGEAGVDISGHRATDLQDLTDNDFDVVVTLCDDANENCPFFPEGTRTIHKGFDDPPKLAEGVEDEEEALTHYRRVRDEIRLFVDELSGSLVNGRRDKGELP